MIVDITRKALRKGFVAPGGHGIFRPYFPTANAAFRRTALVEVGGFDERCRTGEDVDVCLRLADSGYDLWYQPSASVIHLHRTSLRQLLAQWYGYAVCHPYLYRKHLPGRRLSIYTFRHGDSTR